MTDSKNKRNLDSFVEDLDDLEKSLQNLVDSAEEDETLNRLLVEDINPDTVVGEIDDIDILVNEDNLVHHIDEVSTPELEALGLVGHVDEQKATVTKATHEAPDPAINEHSSVEELAAYVEADKNIVAQEIEILHHLISEITEKQLLLGRELHQKADQALVHEWSDRLNQMQVDVGRPQRYERSTATQSDKDLLQYVPTGMGAVALLTALVLGWQTQEVQSELAILQQKLAQHEQQLGQLPASDAATQSLRAQVDTLTQSGQLLSEQQTELLKTQATTTKSNEEQGKQLTKLQSQTKQLDDTMDALQGRVASLEKSKPVSVQPAKIDKTPDSKKVDKVEVGVQNWTVTLVGSKQEWYAAKKAEEYAAKGFQVKISRSLQKGEPWFRLFSDGFKSQQDADAYATKARKVLNLDSVSVGHN